MNVKDYLSVLAKNEFYSSPVAVFTLDRHRLWELGTKARMFSQYRHEPSQVYIIPKFELLNLIDKI